MIKRLLVFLLPLFFFTAGCNKKTECNDGKPTVLVSIPPYSYFVHKIAGDTVHIQTLIPAGANPHLYEVTPRQARDYQNADLWLYLGEPLDLQVLQFFKESKKEISTVDITEGIDLSSSHCHHHAKADRDLHLWLSPTLAKAQIHKIAQSLISLLPEKKTEFQANTEHLLAELDRLDEEIKNLLTPLQGSTILVSHPAFAYFCKDYHLTQLSIEMEGKDPLPQHIAHVLQKAQASQIRKVLTQPQYSNKGAELVANYLNCPTYLVDPYSENYTENLLHIAQIIAQ